MKYSITKFTIALFLCSLSSIALTNNTPKTNNETECQIEVAFEYAVENLRVQFNNASMGDYNQLQWDFGDQVQSEEINPTHEYSKEGMYRFCVTATNSLTDCSKQYCAEVYVFE
ncbi:MAG: PKD domain-containing protein [Chitinophagales bacterium]